MLVARSLAIGTLLLAIASVSASATDGAVARKWAPCSGHPRKVRHLQVSHLTCAKARRAIKRGKFDLTPGGPLFSTREFRCRSPVGPPVDGPRFTTCRHEGRAFRFYSFAEPR